MQQVTKQKYLYYIAFMLIASAFLPLVFNNLPRFLRTNYLWATLWLVSLLVFYPKTFYNRTILYILAYGFIIFFATKTIWSNMDDWNHRLLFLEFFQIVTGASVITYFLQSKDYIGLAKITRWAIIFLFITAIMTIISTAIDPRWARNIAEISKENNVSEMEELIKFRRYGGGYYPHAIVFMCLFPIFIYYYKNIKTSLVSRKQIIIISVIIFLALLGMQLFANILIAVGFSIIALLGMKRIRQTMVVIGIFLSVALFTPKEVYVKSLLSISSFFSSESELNYKFKDMSIFIETGANIEDNSTGTGARAERYPMLMETFVKSPLLGCFFLSDNFNNGYIGYGAHLYWMNKLTVTGIIGLFFFMFIPFINIKNNMRYFNTIYKFYYILASLSFLSYGLMKNIDGKETWYAFFILLPGLYYLPLLKGKKATKNLR